MESDGVELALVQVDRRQLVGLVRGSQRTPQGKLELVPEPLGWGAGVGTGVDRTGVLFLEGIAIGERLETHKAICLEKTGPRLEYCLSLLLMTLNTPQDLGQGKNRTRATSAAGSRR